ncbi:MAG: glycosyltransferase family 39 protein [Verrucomicrobiae bacterium]|nr:glycosyltransferase family 39 protein [Verrucomicrobiae bacterium]
MAGLILFIILSALRLPWAGADPGVSSLWSYGVFTGDEGKNTGGGRLFYLTGSFLDPDLSEPTAMMWAWGQMLISYLGYAIFGLSDSAIRIPSMVLSIGAWVTIYAILSRKTHPWLSFLLVLIVSSNPVSLTYERTFSGDIVMGSLIVFSFASILRQKSCWHLVSGLLMATAFWCKLSALFLFPLVLLGLLCKRFTVKKTACFILGIIIASTLMYGTRWWAIHSYTQSPTAEVLALLDTEKPFSPGSASRSIMEIFNSLAIFPRYPLNFQFGYFLPFLLLVPALWISSQNHWLPRKKRDWETAAVGLGCLIYVACLSVQVRCVLRNFLPVFFYVPLLIFYLGKIPKPRHALSLLSFLGLLVWILFCMAAFSIPTALRVPLQEVFYNEYVIPASLAWSLTPMKFLLVLAVSAVMAWFLLREYAYPKLRALFIAIPVTLLCLGGQSYYQAILATSPQFPLGFLPEKMLTILLIACILMAWVRPSRLQNTTLRFVFLSTVLAIMTLLNGSWRPAYHELARMTYFERQATESLIRSLPKNAIILGRRPPTLLRSTPFRVGLQLTESPVYGPRDFVDQLKMIIRKNPGIPVFLMAETQGSIQLRHLQEVRDPELIIRPHASIPLVADGARMLQEHIILEIKIKQAPPAN